MRPNDIKRYEGQIVRASFVTGAVVRLHVLSVDPDVGENHVFYDPLEVLEPGTPPFDPPKRPIGFAASASDFTALTPTDGKRYAAAPGSRLLR